jgi:hypothetical protein
MSLIFDDEQELQGHLVSGIHTLITSSTDLDKLVKNVEVPRQAQTNLQQISSETDTYSNGWAIRKRKKPIRLTQKQKTFLQECYDIGEKTGNKLTADSVHKLMRTKR